MSLARRDLQSDFTRSMQEKPRSQQELLTPFARHDQLPEVNGLLMEVDLCLLLYNQTE